MRIPVGGRGPRWSSGRQREPPVKALGARKLGAAEDLEAVESGQHVAHSQWRTSVRSSKPSVLQHGGWIGRGEDWKQGASLLAHVQ